MGGVRKSDIEGILVTVSDNHTCWCVLYMWSNSLGPPVSVSLLHAVVEKSCSGSSHRDVQCRLLHWLLQCCSSGLPLDKEVVVP